MDILLQGILSVQVPLFPRVFGAFDFVVQQFTTYFKHYPDDRLLLKLAVAGLVLFTTLKSCQSLYVTQLTVAEFLIAAAECYGSS